jgi:hypothetical protein
MAGSVELPDAMFNMAERLLDCAGAALAATDAGAPARALVATGAEIAWDNCECGQLSVHVLRTYPADTFPVLKQSGPYERCQTTFTVVEYVVTILRCVPVQDDSGQPPVPAAMTAAARTDFTDRWAVRSGVMCCLADDNPLTRNPMLVQEQLAIGDEGMCAGSELHVLIGFSNCNPCGGG